MNQLMTIEPADRTEHVHRTLALQSRDTPISDRVCDEVAKAASRRFQSSHNFELKRVVCEIRRGAIVIRGQVSSYYLKQLAQESVRPLAGVNRIVNQLEVIYARPIQEEVEA